MYDFIVGFTIFYNGYFKTRYKHFDNISIAKMFCSNKNLKNNSKIYIDYDLFNYVKERINDIVFKSYNDVDYFNRDIRLDIEKLLEEIERGENGNSNNKQ